MKSIHPEINRLNCKSPPRQGGLQTITKGLEGVNKKEIGYFVLSREGRGPTGKSSQKKQLGRKGLVGGKKVLSKGKKSNGMPKRAAGSGAKKKKTGPRGVLGKKMEKKGTKERAALMNRRRATRG